MTGRILFVVDGLAGGGAERTILTLAREMVGRGLDVDIASLRAEQAYPIPDGVSFIPCYDTGPRRLRKIGEIRRRARQLDAALSGRPRWDLVVSTLLTSDRIVAASRLADTAWYRVPNTLSVDHLGVSGTLKRARRRARLDRTYSDRKVIAVSAGVGRDLIETVGARPARLEVIHNPFDTTEIRRLSEEPCPLEGEDYLVSVGRLHRQKRHDRLLGAFALSRYEGRLVIVGAGSSEQVRRLAERADALGVSQRVDLVGFKENPYPLMRHARALVSSSDFEGFPRVLVESLICGTPVASTNCPSGPEEILTGDLSVGLADLAERSLADAIDRVVDGPPVIGPEHVHPFLVRRITDQYLGLAERGATD
jgi:glycosyltransferase involved in cell wall biosynthesis